MYRLTGLSREQSTHRFSLQSQRQPSHSGWHGTFHAVCIPHLHRCGEADFVRLQASLGHLVQQGSGVRINTTPDVDQKASKDRSKQAKPKRDMFILLRDQLLSLYIALSFSRKTNMLGRVQSGEECQIGPQEALGFHAEELHTVHMAPKTKRPRHTWGRAFLGTSGKISSPQHLTDKTQSPSTGTKHVRGCKNESEHSERHQPLSVAQTVSVLLVYSKQDDTCSQHQLDNFYLRRLPSLTA